MFPVTSALELVLCGPMPTKDKKYRVSQVEVVTIDQSDGTRVIDE